MIKHPKDPRVLKYSRRPDKTVFAVQLDLDTEGLTYVKWGGVQHAKPGDWLVKNGPDTYTVDKESFAKTYTLLSGAEYFKSASVWAEEQKEAGSTPTKEGGTAFNAGDYVVYNDDALSDGYAIERDKFEALYVLAE